MSRQHAAPILVPAAGPTERLAAAPADWSEDRIQALVHDHPECLPIREIDPIFADPVALCQEMTTTAGSIDNVMVTPAGLPVLVECKLWRNPQARREVIGQILDYATALSRWTASDLQREVSRRTDCSVVELVRAAGHEVDEIAFTDALTLNLRRGRFLLLIVGDGIREGVEAIAEYLQAHSGLHFTLGLVEMPVFLLSDGSRLVTPRVLARTVSITREVVALPTGFVLQADQPIEADTQDQFSDEEVALRRSFLQDVLSGLDFDDPDQPMPRITAKGWLNIYLPAPSNSCWIVVLLQRQVRRVGVRLSANANSVGNEVMRRLLDDWEAIRDELGGNPVVRTIYTTRIAVDEYIDIYPDGDAAEREMAISWVCDRLRTYVSVFRPRVRNAVQALEEV